MALTGLASWLYGRVGLTVSWRCAKTGTVYCTYVRQARLTRAWLLYYSTGWLLYPSYGEVEYGATIRAHIYTKIQHPTRTTPSLPIPCGASHNQSALRHLAYSTAVSCAVPPSRILRAILDRTITIPTTLYYHYHRCMHTSTAAHAVVLAKIEPKTNPRYCGPSPIPYLLPKKELTSRRCGLPCSAWLSDARIEPLPRVP